MEEKEDNLSGDQPARYDRTIVSLETGSERKAASDQWELRKSEPFNGLSRLTNRKEKEGNSLAMELPLYI